MQAVGSKDSCVYIKHLKWRFDEKFTRTWNIGADHRSQVFLRHRFFFQKVCPMQFRTTDRLGSWQVLGAIHVNFCESQVSPRLFALFFLKPVAGLLVHPRRSRVDNGPGKLHKSVLYEPRDMDPNSGTTLFYHKTLHTTSSRLTFRNIFARLASLHHMLTKVP